MRRSTLEEAKARFEAWRQNRKGKAAIPDELWAAAAEVARKEGGERGVSQSCWHGGLAYNKFSSNRQKPPKDIDACSSPIFPSLPFCS
jgi:hypothetical protein